uniref:Uncharacterized protein n=1 Tax=Mimivirus LCMiAC02 TaxID=2506609 RepID=A0A481Z223_9VIRU|nr:MAG: hypothetical protein LCMiAC02_05500 [Mimivirus LCMiAC02]
MVGIGGSVGGEVGNSIGDYLGNKAKPLTYERSDGGETIGYKFPILRTIIGSGIGGIICGKFGEFLFNEEKNKY